MKDYIRKRKDKKANLNVVSNDVSKSVVNTTVVNLVQEETY